MISGKHLKNLALALVCLFSSLFILSGCFGKPVEYPEKWPDAGLTVPDGSVRAKSSHIFSISGSRSYYKCYKGPKYYEDYWGLSFKTNKSWNAVTLHFENYLYKNGYKRDYYDPNFRVTYRSKWYTFHLQQVNKKKYIIEWVHNCFPNF